MYPCTHYHVPMYPVPMYQCTNVPMYHVPMHPCTHVPCTLYQCTLYPCTHVPCTPVPMYPCTHVHLYMLLHATCFCIEVKSHTKPNRNLNLPPKIQIFSEFPWTKISNNPK